MSARPKTRRSRLFSQLPEELLREIFQYLPFITIAGTLIRVCKRWKGLILTDSRLLAVIDIPPAFAVSKTILKILKQYGNTCTKVLRIRRLRRAIGPYAIKCHMSSRSWDSILGWCPNLQELYIENGDIQHLRNSSLLPSSICRIFFINCCYGNNELWKLLPKPITHSNIELLEFRRIRMCFTGSALGVLKKYKNLKYLGLSFLSTTYGDSLEHLHSLKKLTHLDIHGSRLNVTSDQVKSLLQALINLEKIDISGNTIWIEDIFDEDFGLIWADIWADSTPKLSVVKTCRVVIRSSNSGVSKLSFMLDNPFRSRSLLKVIGCATEEPHLCPIKSILPSPVTLPL